MGVKRTKSAARRRKAAATTDIVASPRAPLQVPTKWKKHYQRLIATRDFLLGRKDDLARDASEEQPAFSLHMADAGTDSFDRDFALSRISSESDALYEIDQALDRIYRGTYGLCELTGKKIERDRLEAIPWTRFCADAEKQLERDGSVRRAHLAPRTAMARGSGAENEAAGATEDENLEQE